MNHLSIQQQTVARYGRAADVATPSRSAYVSAWQMGVFLGVLLSGAVLPCPAASDVVYSQGLALPVTRSANEMIIELDGQRDTDQVAIDLATAGFPTLSRIEGTPERRHYRRIEVNPYDAAALQTIRGIAGVQALRSTYVLPGLAAPLIHTGQVIAKFKPGTTLAEVNAIAARFGTVVERQVAGLPQAYILKVLDESTADAVAVAAALHADPQIVYSHPSFILKDVMQYTAIEDPLFVFQWHLNNTGQLARSRIGADIQALKAWDITEGAGAVAGVIDTGLQREHEDLVDNYLTGFDFRDQDGDPSPSIPFSIEGHGTSCAGLIAARANNIGLRGVAPFSQLIGCRLGADFAVTAQDIAEAFTFCEANGAMVISNSYHLNVFPFIKSPQLPRIPAVLLDVLVDAIDQVVTAGRSGKGVLVMFSSGNAAIPVSFDNPLAVLPGVMAIGATMRDDTLSCYSSFGDEQSVVAPGGGVDAPRSLGGTAGAGPCFEADMATTDIQDFTQPLLNPITGLPIIDPITGLPIIDIIRGFNPATKFVFDPRTGVPYEVPDPDVLDFPDTGYTHQFNGTSSACPVAAGVAALVFSVNPNLTAENALNLIEHTADKVQALNEYFDPVTGHNERYGHGRVNAFRSVQAVVAGQNWPSPVKDIQNVSSQALVRLFWSNPVNDAAGILVARGTGQLNWAPTDGIEYTVGQQVASNVVIVANDLIDALDQPGLPTDNFQYALFVRNAAHFYSWGRRTSFSAESASSKPLASISANPTVGITPLKVHFAGGGIDKSGIIGFSWNFGDGSTGFGAAADHTYTTGGNYMATLTVTNTLGNTGQTSVQIVALAQANKLPTASFTASPSTGDAPLVVLFSAQATDTDGTIALYLWNFGDGTTANGKTVEHIYLVPGTYGVVLTVTDNDGGPASATQLLTVTGTAPTAAQTQPPGILNAVPNCGAGATGASIAASMFLLGVMLVRRRQ